jgi:tetratricopeptide (TPR) repeat protein
VKLLYHLIIAFSFFISALQSANAQVDSLKRELQTLEKQEDSFQRDTLIANTLIQLFFYEKFADISYINRVLAITQKHNWVKGQVLAYANLSFYYIQNANYPLALENCMKALPLSEQIKDIFLTAKINNDIGIVYQNLGEYEKAISYFEKTYQLMEQAGKSKSLGTPLTGIAEVYKLQKNYPKALEYNYKALEVRQKAGSTLGVAISKHNIGEIYVEMGEINKGLEYLFEGLAVDKKMGDSIDIAIDTYVISKGYLKLGKNKESIAYASESLRIAKKINARNEIKNVAEILYLNYKTLGKHQEALTYHELFTTYQDSIFNKENVLKISKLENNLQVVQKQHEIDLLHTENENQKLNQILLVVLVGIVLLSFISTIIYLRSCLSYKK